MGSFFSRCRVLIKSSVKHVHLSSVQWPVTASLDPKNVPMLQQLAVSCLVLKLTEIPGWAETQRQATQHDCLPRLLDDMD